MKAHYYKHQWKQEQGSRFWQCSECEERTVYYPQVGQYITLWTANNNKQCLKVIDYRED